MESTDLSIGEKEGWELTQAWVRRRSYLLHLIPAFYNSLLQCLTVLWPTNKSRGHNKESMQRNRGAENARDDQVPPVKPKFRSSANLRVPGGRENRFLGVGGNFLVLRCLCHTEVEVCVYQLLAQSC